MTSEPSDPTMQSARRLGSRAPSVAVVESGAGTRVVTVAGELDARGRDHVSRLCTDGDDSHVVVDLSGLTFLDCGGYRAFATSHAELGRRDRTLALIGATGEPRRLLDLIRMLDPALPS